MEFFAVNFFLALYYIRPHEWIPAFGSLHPIMLVTGVAILALFRRKEGVNKSELLKTPHDWMMLAYFIWLVMTSHNPLRTFLDTNNIFAFYWIAVLTLNTIERLTKFLIWWNIMILVVAAMAIGSEFGFDIVNSYDLTHGKMLGRLSLNTSIFDNPNALGHSVVGAVVMFYFLGFWNRSVIWKIFTPIAMIMPLSCIYMTQSKGAFLSGFATLANAMTFKRPLAVKILIFTIAGTFGWMALSALPRMQDLESTNKNEAIAGRVAAFQFGLGAMNSHIAGIGYGTFQGRFYDANGYSKTAHSSYVEAGAELGLPGLFLFLGVLYCSLRTLLTAKTTNGEEERIRRVLFGLFVSFTVSSWMICWTYRATYYLMAAAIAAFHRQMLLKNQTPPIPQTPGIEIQIATPIGIPTTATAAFTSAKSEKPVAPANGIAWNRVTITDFVIMALLTFASIQYWQYVMNQMRQ